MAKKKTKEDEKFETTSITISCDELGFKKEITGSADDLDKYWNDVMQSNYDFALGVLEDSSN